MPLQNNVGQKVSSHNANQISVVKSSSFKFGGEDCFFEDDGVIENGVGKINIVKETTTTLDNGVVVPVSHQLIAEGVGFVNYETGRIVLENVSFQSVIGNVLTISVRPRDRDITAQQRSILRILNSDLNINIQQVRI
jgi:hypothetical protein